MYSLAEPGELLAEYRVKGLGLCPNRTAAMKRVLDTLKTLLMTATLGLVTACGAQCQAPAQTAFTSVVQTAWRLVETTDPQAAASLDNYNFLIMTFARNNTGQIQKVVDNEEFGAVLTMVWVPTVSQSKMTIQ